MTEPEMIEACEKIVRHTEVSGSELLSKAFILPNGKIGAVIWCLVGENAARFNLFVEKWLESEGFREDVK